MKLSDLIEQIKLKKSYLCVGIDPDFDKIPEHIKRKVAKPNFRDVNQKWKNRPQGFVTYE